MGLFDPAWMTDNEKKLGKAIAYVDRVKDDVELATIARQAHFKEVQRAAIEHIADQTVLAEIAMQGKSYDFATEAAFARISDLAQLDRVARGADDINTRWLALQRLVERFGPVDLAPYADDIAAGVRAANREMLALSDDLALMEEAYDHLRRMDSEWTRDRALEVRERANQVAFGRIEASSDLDELNRISDAPMYGKDVRAAAKQRLVLIVATEGADPRQLLEAACANPAVRDAVLPRIADELLLCEAVERIALLGSDSHLEDVEERIGDATLLERIARNEKLEPITRWLAAIRANVEAPFGTRTLVCPECGDPVVCHEAYKDPCDSYNPWEPWTYFKCEKHCGDYRVTRDPLVTFPVGNVQPDELRGHLIFLCPNCGKLKGGGTYRKPKHLGVCTCGSAAVPLPVKHSLDC